VSNKIDFSLEELDARLEKAVKSVKETNSPQWMRVLSLLTAVLAVFTAWASLKGGGFSGRAMMSKNEAVFNQARASDQWAFFQSKGIKGMIKESELDRSQGAKRKKLQEDIARYDQEKAEISAKAKALEDKANECNELVTKLGQPGKAFGYSVTLFQVGIALSGLAALTKRRWIWFFGLGVAVCGLAYFAQGYWLAWHLGIL
jgi:hypothetical protein